MSTYHPKGPTEAEAEAGELRLRSSRAGRRALFVIIYFVSQNRG